MSLDGPAGPAKTHRTTESQFAFARLRRSAQANFPQMPAANFQSHQLLAQDMIIPPLDYTDLLRLLAGWGRSVLAE